MLNREEALLAVIDIQGNLYLAMDEKEFLLTNTAKLIKGINVLDIPIILTEQVKIGPTIPELAGLMPDVKPINKNSFSCCGDAQFMAALTASGRKQVLVCGIEAHVCAYQTSMDLMERGFEVYVVADAVSSRTAGNREIGIQKLLASGAILTSTEMALFELLKTATDPKAKDVFKIIK
ncbi:MAG: hydrolase [Syntrophales bacterium]|jgi:isochorismate hydrolase|nr:hydrolase [Syntrophales bacterium]MCK9390658.1 hydrolase [Syntrophales bacterium]